MDPEQRHLARFPPVFSSSAEIPGHQLGWRLAVLPFRSMGAPVGYNITLGLAEEISAEVSRFRSPRLIAPATFWDGTGPVPDALARCKTYELDYVIDGTIHVNERQVRVNVTLTDVVLDFEVIWTGRFVGTLDDLFSLKERIASEVVAQLDPDLFQRGSVVAAPAGTKVAAAHHAVLVAIQAIFRLHRAKFMRARGYLSQATELDPEYSTPHAWMAYWSIMAVGQGWAANPREVIELAGTSAERALALDPLDARAIAIAGHVKGYLQHDVGAALRLHARAIELNPNLPIAWTLSCWSKIYSGDHATAIRHALMSQSLSPQDPHIFFVEHALMTAYFFRRQLQEAETLAEIVVVRNPGHTSALNVRLAILGHLGRAEEAAECLAGLREVEPSISVEKIASRAPLRPADRAFYTEGLRLAGVPD
jgi:TolB-like protein